MLGSTAAPALGYWSAWDAGNIMPWATHNHPSIWSYLTCCTEHLLGRQTRLNLSCLPRHFQGRKQNAVITTFPHNRKAWGMQDSRREQSIHHTGKVFRKCQTMAKCFSFIYSNISITKIYKVHFRVHRKWSCKLVLVPSPKIKSIHSVFLIIKKMNFLKYSHTWPQNRQLKMPGNYHILLFICPSQWKPKLIKERMFFKKV